MKNFNFFEVTFTLLEHVRVLFLILITFWSNLVLFGVMIRKDQEIQDGGSKIAAV